MTIFRSVDYDTKLITATTKDTNQGNFIWVGMTQDSDGNCRIKKVSAQDPRQIYFDFDLAVDGINTMLTEGNYLFTGVNHATKYIYRFLLLNPLATPTSFTLPAGVTEAPVHVVKGGSYLWWLFPGSASGEVAKIVKTNLSGTYQSTITLSKSAEVVNDARRLAYRSDSGELWVTTYTSPANLVRVFNLSTTPDFSVTSIS